jgi:hypothetical protein
MARRLQVLACSASSASPSSCSWCRCRPQRSLRFPFGRRGHARRSMTVRWVPNYAYSPRLPYVFDAENAPARPPPRFRPDLQNSRLFGSNAGHALARLSVQSYWPMALPRGRLAEEGGVAERRLPVLASESSGLVLGKLTASEPPSSRPPARLPSCAHSLVASKARPAAEGSAGYVFAPGQLLWAHQGPQTATHSRTRSATHVPHRRGILLRAPVTTYCPARSWRSRRSIIRPGMLPQMTHFAARGSRGGGQGQPVQPAQVLESSRAPVAIDGPWPAASA